MNTKMMVRKTEAEVKEDNLMTAIFGGESIAPWRDIDCTWTEEDKKRIERAFGTSDEDEIAINATTKVALEICLNHSHFISLKNKEKRNAEDVNIRKTIREKKLVEEKEQQREEIASGKVTLYTGLGEKLSGKSIDESRADYKKSKKCKKVTYKDDILKYLKSELDTVYGKKVLENNAEFVLRLQDADYIVRCTTKKNPLKTWERASTPKTTTKRDTIMDKVGIMIAKYEEDVVNAKTHGWIINHSGEQFTVKVTKKSKRVAI